MFRQITPLSLFATPVYAQELPPDAASALDSELSAAADELGAGAAPGPLWRSHHDLHRRVGFGGLAALLMEASLRILAQMRSVQQEPAITALWATREAPGASLPTQLQQNAYLGALYLARGNGEDRVRFLDPRPQAHLIAGPTSAPTATTSPDATLPLKPGRLLLFPAWFWHMTLPNPGPAPRLLFHAAVSFAGFVEAMSVPRWSGPNAEQQS